MVVATDGEEESDDEAAMAVKGASEMALEAEDTESMHEDEISSDESDASAEASDDDDDDDDDLEEEEDNADATCMTCDLDSGESHLVLCDGRGCDAACHTWCMENALPHVPDGPWFCSPGCEAAAVVAHPLQRRSARLAALPPLRDASHADSESESESESDSDNDTVPRDEAHADDSQLRLAASTEVDDDPMMVDEEDKEAAEEEEEAAEEEEEEEVEGEEEDLPIVTSARRLRRLDGSYGLRPPTAYSASRRSRRRMRVAFSKAWERQLALFRPTPPLRRFT